MKACRLVSCLIVLAAFAVPAFAQEKGVDPVLVPGKSAWPAKDIPSAVPEYKGKVANYGNGGEKNWFQIYVAETNPKNVQDYLALYWKAGWTLSKDGSSDKAVKDQYEVTVSYYSQSGLVGITIVTKSTKKQWPAKQFPQVPQFTECLASDYAEYEFNLSVRVHNAKEADIASYKRMLLGKGWEGDPEGSEFSYPKSNPPLSLQIDDQGSGEWSFDISK